MRAARREGATKRSSRQEPPATVLSDSSRDELLQAIARLLHMVGGRRSRFLRLGFNGVMRALERGRCEAIVLSREAPAVLADPLREAARLRRVPLVTIPKASAELSKLLSVRSVVVVATVTQVSEETEGAEGAASVAEEDAMLATMDHLRDLIASLAATATL